MARGQRVDIGDVAYHVINRSNGRVRIFENDSDYRDFEYLLNEVRETYDMRILAYIIMPNHWHLLLYPKKDGDLAKAIQWLSTSHAHRHHVRKGTVGTGHLYQGRYKSFPIQEDRHLLTVFKYIERNAVRARLCESAEAWRWGSAHRRLSGNRKLKTLLSDLPVDLPTNYRIWINEPEPSEELKNVRLSAQKELPYGEVLL